MSKNSIFIGAGIVVLCVILSGCGSSTPTLASASEVVQASGPATAVNPMEVHVKPELMLEVKVGKPKWQPVSNTLSAAGHVEANEGRMTRVTSPATGRIIELNVTLGELVEKGQVVATIYSTELATAQSDYLKALTAQQQHERAISRAKQLLAAGVIGSAELQRREADGQQNATEIASLRKQLQVLGMPDEAISKLETTRAIDSMTQVVAAASGLVLERHATPGQVVQAADAICVLADLSSVWLVADVPEEYARALRVGKEVKAEIPALPGETLRGKLAYVGATVNPETRTIRARMELQNPDRRYKPAMLATMLLMDNAEPRMTVPLSAVVRDGNDEGIFIQTASDRYELKHVTFGEEVGDSRVVLDGLPDGATIVIEGSFHLNNERIRQASRGDTGA